MTRAERTNGKDVCKLVLHAGKLLFLIRQQQPTRPQVKLPPRINAKTSKLQQASKQPILDPKVSCWDFATAFIVDKQTAIATCCMQMQDR